MSIADYLLNKEQLRAQKMQNFYNNVLNTVKTGTDVWNTLQEQNKYKPGSDYMTAQKQIALDWPLERTKAELDAQLQSEKSWWQYKKDNPEMTEEEQKANYLMSPAGQEYLDMQEKRARAASDYETANRIREIRAQQQGGGLSDRSWTAYDRAIKSAQEKFLTLDVTGNPVWKPGINRDAVRNFLYGFAEPPFADAQSTDALKRLFDQWVNDPTLPGATAGSTPGYLPPGTGDAAAAAGRALDYITQVASTIQGSPYQRDVVQPQGGRTPFLFEGGVRNWRAEGEKKIEQDLGGLRRAEGSMTPEDQGALEWALSETSKPGFLSPDLYDKIAKFSESLKSKYAGAIGRMNKQLLK